MIRKIYEKIRKIFNLLKLNYQIYKLNKRKAIIFKEIGILVYEFYNVNKSILEDEEMEALISEVKDIEIEVDTIEKKIEEIRNPYISEKEEISNELLLGEPENDGENKENS